MDKAHIFNQPDVSEVFEKRILRFSGGKYLDAVEKAFLLEHLPRNGSILDLACGSGRFTRYLEEAGFNVFGMDYSRPMLTMALQRNISKLVRADAFRLPFRDNIFASLVAVHFVYHYPDIGEVLKEMSRVVAPKGRIIFDVNRFSTRKSIYIHTPQAIATACQRLNLLIENLEFRFVFSQVLYYYTPKMLLPCLKMAERIFPRFFKVKIFFVIAKN